MASAQLWTTRLNIERPPVSRRLGGDGRPFGVCVCTSYKYIILCERVGVCPKTVVFGDARCVQFAFRPLNKGSDDTPKTHTRIEQVILNVKTRLK